MLFVSVLEVGPGFHEGLTGRENIYLKGSAILGITKYLLLRISVIRIRVRQMFRRQRRWNVGVEYAKWDVARSDCATRYPHDGIRRKRLCYSR